MLKGHIIDSFISVVAAMILFLQYIPGLKRSEEIVHDSKPEPMMGLSGFLLSK